MLNDDEILKLEPHQIIVFGSNNEGRHGKGLALICKNKFGAVQFKSMGLQGQSYAIVTKDLQLGMRSIPLSYIKKQLLVMYVFAKNNPEKEIIMTKIGTNNAGYSEKEIKGLLNEIEVLRPPNVILPQSWSNKE